MLGADERPEGHIKVFFVDNTYKTLPLKSSTTVGEVLEWVCKRLSAGGRYADPARHELIILAPGNQTLRERRLLREDKPLQIQEKGAIAFKFLFREASADSSPTAEDAGSIAQAPAPGAPPGPSPPSTSPNPGITGQNAQEADGPAPEETNPPASQPAPASAQGGAVAPMETGTLERLMEDKTSWYQCMVILDEDRLWYSPAPSGEKDGIGRYGGGMVFLPLCDCDKVMEGDDKRLLQLLTKNGSMTLRARNAHERNRWLLAIVKQAALIKERDILLQAEKIISGMEFRRASAQVAKLEALGRLPTVLANANARELLLEFARSEHKAQNIAGDMSVEVGNAGVPAHQAATSNETHSQKHASLPSALPHGARQTDSAIRWPEDLSLERLITCLERKAAAAGNAAGEAGEEDRTAWNFAETSLFPRFKEHPVVQCRMCWIAAGIE